MKLGDTKGWPMNKRTICGGAMAGFLLALGVTACVTDAAISANAPVAAANSSVPPGSVALSTDYDDALPLADQLLLGTVLLEGTSNAVDARTAARLLPLWQNAAQMERDPNASDQDIAARMDQIKSAMTPAQIQAIAAMRLTRAKLASTLRQMGAADPQAEGPLGTDAAMPTGTSPAPDSMSTPSGDMWDGRPPQEGGPGGPGAGQPLVTLSPDQIETMQVGGGKPVGPGQHTPMGTWSPEQMATREAGGDRQPQSSDSAPAADMQSTKPVRNGSVRLSPELMDVLIRLLQAKSQS
jgi:hypothetical protein